VRKGVRNNETCWNSYAVVIVTVIVIVRVMVMFPDHPNHFIES